RKEGNKGYGFSQRTETEDEISDRFVAPCFVNGLEAHDGEINLEVEENMILIEFAVKLCLEHEVKRGNKVHKKELIVALRGEICYVETETVIIYPRLDPFLISSDEEEKIDDDCDFFLDNIDFGDIADIEGVNVSQFVFKREALAIVFMKDTLLEKERRVIETMAYSDKYKKILDDICLDKLKQDGMTREEEETIIKVKGEALIEKDDPEAFVIPIRLEGKINLNALVDTRLDINPMPYRVYESLGRDDVGVTTIIAEFLILDMPIDRDTLILVGRGVPRTYGGILNTIKRITSTFDG
nr:hypothetical protein [Tanacetum cinerariifolium]